MPGLQPFLHFGSVVTGVGTALLRFLRASLRSRAALAAENLFLRKQLALYRERQVKPRRASDPFRLTLVLLARCFAWRGALTIVQPATLVRRHREPEVLVDDDYLLGRPAEVPGSSQRGHRGDSERPVQPHPEH